MPRIGFDYSDFDEARLCRDDEARFQAALKVVLVRMQAERPKDFQGPPPDAVDYQMWTDWFETEIMVPAREAAWREVYGA